MPVLVGFRAFRPALWFVTGDTFAAPQSGTFHTRDRLPASVKKGTLHDMNIINKILGKIFPPDRFKTIRKEQEIILRAVIDSLPNDFNEFKSQIQSLTFLGFSDWEMFPEYKFVCFSFPGNTIYEYKKRGQNYLISGIEIYSKKTKKLEAIEILVNDNFLSGFKISNSDYSLDEFDLGEISSINIKKSPFDFPPSKIDLFYDSLDDKIKSMLNSNDIFDIDYNNRTFYAFYDLEDGNYLAVDKNQNVYSLIHDAKPAATKIKYSFEEILLEITAGRFDKDKHVEERYKKSK